MPIKQLDVLLADVEAHRGKPMNLTDIAQQVTSWLSDLEIKKLLTAGLLSSISFSTNNSWWHARVETLSALRVDYQSATNWKQVYQIVKLHIESECHGIWNEYDNLTACKLLSRMGYGHYDRDMIRCCQTGTVEIMSLLLTSPKVNPCHLILHLESLGGLLRLIITHALSLAVSNSQPDIVSLLLEDGRADPAATGIAYWSTLSDACTSRSLGVLFEDRIADNNNPIDKQVAILKMLLAKTTVRPTLQELADCTRAEIVQVLLSDSKIDPTQNNNVLLQRAIRRKNESIVRVYLADSRVAKLVDQHIVEIAREHGTESILELVSKRQLYNGEGL